MIVRPVIKKSNVAPRGPAARQQSVPKPSSIQTAFWRFDRDRGQAVQASCLALKRLFSGEVA